MITKIQIGLDGDDIIHQLVSVIFSYSDGRASMQKVPYQKWPLDTKEAQSVINNAFELEREIPAQNTSTLS